LASEVSPDLLAELAAAVEEARTLSTGTPTGNAVRWAESITSSHLRLRLVGREVCFLCEIEAAKRPTDLGLNYTQVA